MGRPCGMWKTRYVGATDIELTELGHQQAEQLGEMIKNGDYHIDEILVFASGQGFGDGKTYIRDNRNSYESRGETP